MRLLANALSVLLHPLWMPSLTIWLCFRIEPGLKTGFSKELLLFFFAMIFAMTALFPLMSVLLMRRSGLVTDLTMPSRRERIPAYTIALLYYAMFYFLVRRTTADPLMLGICMGMVVSLALVLVITLLWKISAHMTAIGGLVGAILALMLAYEAEASSALAAGLLLAGAVGSARLVASDHSPAQIYAGAVLGGGCVFFCGAYGLGL